MQAIKIKKMYNLQNNYFEALNMIKEKKIAIGNIPLKLSQKFVVGQSGACIKHHSECLLDYRIKILCNNGSYKSVNAIVIVM